MEIFTSDSGPSHDEKIRATISHVLGDSVEFMQKMHGFLHHYNSRLLFVLVLMQLLFYLIMTLGYLVSKYCGAKYGGLFTKAALYFTFLNVEFLWDLSRMWICLDVGPRLVPSHNYCD